MATIGGNLMQRTRCAYFRDPATFPACNKRNPGLGLRRAWAGSPATMRCSAPADACIATYPGDLAVALVAFDAVVHLGERRVAAEDFFLPPATRPSARRHPRRRDHHRGHHPGRRRRRGIRPI